MNKVTRGEKVLNKLVSEGTISKCGSDWLIAAIDPFHDKQLASLQGWPDLESGSSVVRCIKQSVTVARPSTVPATDNWDAHVIQWPWLTGAYANGFSATATRAGQIFTYPNPPATTAPVGGLQIFGMPANTDLSILQAGNVRQIGRLDMDPDYTQGAGRVIGMGFEVHNTTSQLNIQGAVCVYRMMANSRLPTLFVGTQAGGAATYPITGVPVRFPPSNLQQALLLQGSRQWEAKEGCYCVSAFNDAENPAYPIVPTVPIIPAVDDREGAGSLGAFNFANPGVVVAGTTTAASPELRVHPIHQSGAIFSGLSPTTTLTVNWNVYYESFPALSQLDILPLASPSCEYDPDALDLFERILQDLPVGVMVKENGLGDWFLGAISDAAKFVSPLLTATGNPLAMGAGVLTKYIGDTAGNYAKRSNPPSTWETESGGPNDNSTRKAKPKQKAKQTQAQPRKQNKNNGTKPKGGK